MCVAFLVGGTWPYFARRTRSCSRKCHKVCWNLTGEEISGTFSSGPALTLTGTLGPRQCGHRNGGGWRGALRSPGSQRDPAPHPEGPFPVVLTAEPGHPPLALRNPRCRAFPTGQAWTVLFGPRLLGLPPPRQASSPPQLPARALQIFPLLSGPRIRPASALCSFLSSQNSSRSLSIQMPPTPELAGPLTFLHEVS